MDIIIIRERSVLLFFVQILSQLFFFNPELVHESVHRKRAPTPHPNSPLRVYEIPYNQGEKCPLSLYRCYPVPTIHHTVAFLRNVRNACYRHPGQMFLNKDSNAYF